MFNSQVLDKVRHYFPSYQIKYKNQSYLMKIIGLLLFFSPTFLTKYITTIGDSIYYPSESFINTLPMSSLIVLLHETVHMSDEKTYGKAIFSVLWLLPQVLILPLLSLLTICSWKLIVPLCMLCLLPWPAYFRTKFEKRAYIAALYCMQALNTKYQYKMNLQSQTDFYIQQFLGPYYYYMWPFRKQLEQDFTTALETIKSGNRPFQDPVFDMLDDILSVA